MALPPPTRLGRYRILAPSCGVRVSPLQLGAMSIGQAESATFGSMSKEQSFKLLDAFYEAGGNFIDTANVYQMEESETWIGEWMAKRGNRDDMVVATKYTANYKMKQVKDFPIQVNRTGNSFKAMRVSLEDSLKKLQTDYVDIFYVHWWDYSTPYEEMMQGLNTMITQGKVLYLGISDSPAWVVSRANEYARQNGLARFVIYQGKWSAAERDMEKDLLPMCISEGMALAPWGALGHGRFQRKAVQGTIKEGRSSAPLTDRDIKVSAALEQVADDLGVDSITAVALAYLMGKYAYVFPVIGGRKVEHLMDNIQALHITLSDSQMKLIDQVWPMDFGQPYTQFGRDPHLIGYMEHENVAIAGLVDYVKFRPPIDATNLRRSDDLADNE